MRSDMNTVSMKPEILTPNYRRSPFTGDSSCVRHHPLPFGLGGPVRPDLRSSVKFRIQVERSRILD